MQKLQKLYLVLVRLDLECYTILVPTLQNECKDARNGTEKSGKTLCMGHAIFPVKGDLRFLE